MICSHPEFFSFSDPLSILSLSPSLPPSLFLLLFHLLFLSLHLLSSSSIYTSFSVTYFSTAVCSLFAWLLFLPPHWFHLFSILYPHAQLYCHIMSCLLENPTCPFLYCVSFVSPERELLSKLVDHISCRN